MSLSERATRKQLIDKALEAAGWKPIVRYDPSISRDLVALEEYPCAGYLTHPSVPALDE